MPDDNATTDANATELDALKAKADENWDKFLRATAELDNYRKRVARERDEWTRSAREQVVGALLPVLDNLERAIAATREHGDAETPLLAGVEQVHAQLRRTLEEFGLEEVIAHAGHPFDPNLHEAIAQQESAEHPDGTITLQLQRGYKLADRLLRPARVTVSKGAAPADDPTP